MAEVLLLAGVLLGLPILVFTMVTWIGFRRLRRRNEVVVTRPTRPPLRWLASPEPCARLHRRLRDALHVLREAVPRNRRRSGEPAALEAMAAEIEAHAVSLDRDLLIASRLRGQSGLALRRTVAQRIGEIQSAVARLAVAAARPVPPHASDTLDGVTERLDALDAAWAEISRIEREVTPRP